jgi:hypothetical protein
LEFALQLRKKHGQTSVITESDGLLVEDVALLQVDSSICIFGLTTVSNLVLKISSSVRSFSYSVCSAEMRFSSFLSTVIFISDVAQFSSAFRISTFLFASRLDQRAPPD